MRRDARDVHAVFGPQHDPRYGFRDILHATYRFHSGAVATITGGLSFPLHAFRESQGPWGECRHGGFKLVPALDHIDLYWQRLDAPAAEHERFDDLGFDHAYRREIGDFFRWIGSGAEPCLTWMEGLRCVEMMEGRVPLGAARWPRGRVPAAPGAGAVSGGARIGRST